MQFIFGRLVFLFLWIYPYVALAEDPVPPSPPKDQVYIKSIEYAGAGCPFPLLAPVFDAGSPGLHLRMDNYSATPERRSFCTINLNLVYPEGWSYTVYATEYHGSIALDDRVTAAQKTTYFFTGLPGEMKVLATWTGPYVNDHYIVTDIMEDAEQVWSPCNDATTLVIHNKLNIDSKWNRKGNSTIAAHTHILTVQWKQC
ncbi:hypothetical protein BDZ91DRAFT_503251 [Kalaharituber pfeilii]|nr:hypothetical protein BDZ91DRAFT_503251 [Kalaharituber pfeilii]